jgi:hypothetical protein
MQGARIEIVLLSTNEPLLSFDVDGVTNFVVPESSEAQRFKVRLHAPALARVCAILSIHGERDDSSFIGSVSPTGVGSECTIETFKGSFLAFAPTRVDNDVEIDALSASALGHIKVEVCNTVQLSPWEAQLNQASHVPRRTQTSALPQSRKLPERQKKAMMNAMTIVGAGTASFGNFIFDVAVQPIGSISGFYSTAMGHFIRKTLPMSLCHLAIPARVDPDVHNGGDDNDDNDDNQGRARAAKRKWKAEPKAEQAQVEPEGAASSTSTSKAKKPSTAFKITEDGVLDLT